VVSLLLKISSHSYSKNRTSFLWQNPTRPAGQRNLRTDEKRKFGPNFRRTFFGRPTPLGIWMFSGSYRIRPETELPPSELGLRHHSAFTLHWFTVTVEVSLKYWLLLLEVPELLADHLT